MASQITDWLEAHPGWVVAEEDSEDEDDDSEDEDGEGGERKLLFFHPWHIK